MRFRKQQADQHAQRVMTDHERFERDYFKGCMVNEVAHDDRLVFEEEADVLAFIEAVAPHRYPVLSRPNLAPHELIEMARSAIAIAAKRGGAG